MEAKLTILGCGSALPTKTQSPSCQIVEMHDKQFMIDCGEGAQIAIRQMALHLPRLSHIFISHLHGDHCFGLIGLISTWGMIGRNKPLHIHAHADLEKLLRPLLDYHCKEMEYEVVFHAINPRKHEVIYEDKSVRVTTLPLKHRVPTCGFLFEEIPGERHIRKEMIEAHQIPLCKIPAIKAGDNYTEEDGTVIANELLTTPPTPPIRFAYCSDTAYSERVAKWTEGVDCLYHEATYTEEFHSHAKKHQHSTAKEAARIAQLAHAKRLIIGHYSARIKDLQTLLDEAKEVFENTELGVERKEYVIGN